MPACVVLEQKSIFMASFGSTLSSGFLFNYPKHLQISPVCAAFTVVSAQPKAPCERLLGCLRRASSGASSAMGTMPMHVLCFFVGVGFACAALLSARLCGATSP